MMKIEDKEYVLSKIDNEGFDYTFINYSSFEDIKDEKFHELRMKYVESQKELENYLEDEV